MDRPVSTLELSKNGRELLRHACAGCGTTLICASGSRSPARRDQRGDSVDDHAVADRRAVDGRPLRRDRGGPLAVRRERRGRGSHRRPGGRRARPGGGRARRGDLAAHTGARADADPAAGRRSWPTSAPRRSPRRSAPRTARRSPRRPPEAGRSGDLIRLSAFEGTPALRRHPAAGREHGHRLRQDRLHRPPAGGGRRGDHPVQLPVAAGAAQDRAGAGGRERGRSSSRPATPRSPRWRWRRASSTPGCPRVCCRC